MSSSIDDVWKNVNHIPVSAVASYVGSAVLLATTAVQPSVLNTVVALGSAAAMAFYAAESHRSDPSRGHKHSLAYGSRALRTRSPAFVAVSVMGFGLTAIHTLEWRRLYHMRVDAARAHFDDQARAFRSKK